MKSSFVERHYRLMRLPLGLCSGMLSLGIFQTSECHILFSLLKVVLIGLQPLGPCLQGR